MIGMMAGYPINIRKKRRIWGILQPGGEDFGRGLRQLGFWICLTCYGIIRKVHLHYIQELLGTFYIPLQKIRFYDGQTGLECTA